MQGAPRTTTLQPVPLVGLVSPWAGPRWRGTSASPGLSLRPGVPGTGGGKIPLGMDVGNRSAVPRAQELRASNRLELVWSEAVLTQAALTGWGQGAA